MRRRTFFSTITAAGLTSAARAAKVKPGDIPKRVFGKTGERLTIIGQAGGRFPMCSYEDAKAIVLRAYKLGLNYFDCAHVYWDGKSEQVYGEVLAPFRKSIFLTTKSMGRSRKAAEADLAQSLRSLRTAQLEGAGLSPDRGQSVVHCGNSRPSSIARSAV